MCNVTYHLLSISAVCSNNYPDLIYFNLFLGIDQISEEKDSIVLDVLQTRTDDVVKENHELKKEIERLKHEIESDSTLFNMKVVELQNKFYQVEEQIRLKDREIDRLRGLGDCNQSIATETEILEDTLRSGVNAVGVRAGDHTGVGAGVCNTSGIYTSLDAKYPTKAAPITTQVTSCLRQFLMIIVFVAIILLITIVIPLKIAFTP